MNAELALRKGLRSTPKYVPTWYAYDKYGSEFFNIMLKDSSYYYMYSSEISVLKEHVKDIVSEMPMPTILADLGSGNCEKSRLFVDAILERQSKLQFIPIDISEEFLLEASEKIANDYDKRIDVRPLAVEYNDGIEKLRNVNGNKLIVWLGGGFQNQSYQVQVERINHLAQIMSENDQLIISLDVTQDVEQIKLAYMDPSGFAADVYKNAYWRLNRAYGSTINTDRFEFEADFVQRNEPHTCSYVTIKAKANETVTYDIPGLDISLSLQKGEYIHLLDEEGFSCKYTLEQIRTLVQSGNLVLKKIWTDQRNHVATCCIAKK